MQKMIYSLCLFLLSSSLFAQNSPFAVEVAAFAQNVPNGHFGNLRDVYETLDANYIYRYYIDADTKEDAQAKKEMAQKAGFVNAKIVNFDELQENCSATCQYIAPKKTGKEVVPSYGSLEMDIVDIQHLHCIFFDFDQSYIRKDASKDLDILVSVLKKNPKYSVQVLAHTDARGTDAYNNALSERRANSTQRYLNKRGIKSSRISKKTYGEYTPIAKNELENGEDTEIGRQYNRRVEFRILDQYGGLVNIVDKIRVPDDIKAEK